jgi:hypothetical protein
MSGALTVSQIIHIKFLNSSGTALPAAVTDMGKHETQLALSCYVVDTMPTSVEKF